MEPDLVTGQGLLRILATLRRREPLFHRLEIISSRSLRLTASGDSVYVR